MVRPIRPGKPIVAALLNVICCLGGPGYLYLGQVRKAGVAFGIVMGFHFLNWLGIHLGLRYAGLFIGTLGWIFLVLCALDAWTLASRARKGAVVLRDEVAIPALMWMGRPGTAKRDNPPSSDGADTPP
jgi:hypothetical protein